MLERSNRFAPGTVGCVTTGCCDENGFLLVAVDTVAISVREVIVWVIRRTARISGILFGLSRI